ncbi:hypothetical protein Sjap_025788 [Stephania japonica]|uniref:Uncharacterized protein n=1 Tax=Stephania japonica TaxID=461633 RepID=A0AAP0HHV4_9MAGN
MTRPSLNSTPSSSTHNSTPSSSSGATSAGATHDSPASTTHPSTPSSAPPHLPNVEMPHVPALPPELIGEKDVPLIRIIIKNGRHDSGRVPLEICTAISERQILGEMEGYFDWDPKIATLIMAAYESKVKERYKALMHDLLTEGERPIYVTEEAWRRYVEY